MSAIVIRPAPREPGTYYGPEFMPFTSRQKVAQEINRAWKEFVEEMHDGELAGEDVAEKFWKFVTGT